MPGASTVNFDLITKERIFDAINNTNLTTKKDLVKDYKLLKYKLGTTPTMLDFIEHGSRDPFSYIDYAGSYYAFISGIEDSLKGQLTTNEQKLLEFYSREVCNGKRIEEVLLLKFMITDNALSLKEFNRVLSETYDYTLDTKTLNACIDYLNMDFFKEQDQKKYGNMKSIIYSSSTFKITKELLVILENENFKKYLLDSLEYAIGRYNLAYSKNKFVRGFLLYEKYSRKDVCRILNWDKDEASTMYGYRIKHNTCPIFVTYEKKEDISGSTKYEDYFINSRRFNWMTRNRIRMDSSEVVNIKAHEETGLRICLFVKKSDAEGSDFYYMGDMTPAEFHEVTIKNDKGEELPIVNIVYNMEVPVEDNVFGYLES